MFNLPEEIQEKIWKEVFLGSLDKLKWKATVKNTCCCCFGGYYELNDFGLCNCYCSKCYEMMSECRYNCEYYKQLKYNLR